MTDEHLEDRLAELKTAYREGALDGLQVSEPLRRRVWNSIDSRPVNAGKLGRENSRSARGRIQHGSWAIGVGMLAAGLLALAVVEHGRQARTSTPSARHHHSAPSLVLTPSTAVDRIDMLNGTQGWAMTQNGQVLRTGDGGATWQDVTPKGMPKVPLGNLSLQSTDPNHAWIALAQNTPNKPTVVYLTTDGGRTWSSVATVQSVWPQIGFLNQSSGFMLLHLGAGGGSEGVTLLRTSDGGRHWTVAVNGMPAAHPPVIFGGDKSGFGFADAQNGWLTGEWAANFILLYATHDGGTHWQVQNLPVPRGLTAQGGSAISQPPLFADPHDGVLPVEFLAHLAQVAVFYRTTDGGRNWTPTTPVHGSVYSVINASDIFVTDGVRIYRSVDGGRQWTTVEPNRSLQGATALDFVSLSDGWAIAHGQLLRTSDGGSTWTNLSAHAANHQSSAGQVRVRAHGHVRYTTP